MSTPKIPRNDSTPELKAMWDVIENVAARCPLSRDALLDDIATAAEQIHNNAPRGESDIVNWATEILALVEKLRGIP